VVCGAIIKGEDSIVGKGLVRRGFKMGIFGTAGIRNGVGVLVIRGFANWGDCRNINRDSKGETK